MVVRIITRILTANCQTGTPVKPNRTMVTTGDVKGKMVKTTQMGLLGKIIMVEENHRGETAIIVKIEASCWPSRAEAAMAPVIAESTAKME